MSTNNKNKIYKYLNSEMLGVISTVNEQGFPEAALVGFGETKDLHLVFGTYNNTRKYKNIMSNPYVAFTVGGINNITVQYQGKAYELQGQEFIKYTASFFKKNPAANIKKPKQRYFKILPSWIRYSNQTTGDIFEISFE